MKKIISTIIVFAFFANLNAQLKVDSLGNVGIGGVAGTIDNAPITFKVNGSLAGFTGSSANSNVSFGFGSLPNSLAGTNNTVLGFNAFFHNINGNGNTVIGNSAFYNISQGSNNTVIGFGTGWDCMDKVTCSTAIGNATTAASNAVALGYSALAYGSYSISIGNNAVTFGNNSIVIGYSTIVSGNNQIVIGNNDISSAKIGVIWSITSDGRAKKNVQSNVPGLDFINRLQPVTYNLDLDALDELQKPDDPKINAFRDSLRMAVSPEEKAATARARADKEKEVYSGFVAQDVEKAALSLGYNFNGVDAPKNGKGSYGLRYAEFVVPLVKAVQELSAKNDAKDATISSLQEQINELTGLVNKLLGKNTTEPSILRSENSGASATGLTELVADVPASLEQNVPNPFNHATVVHYTLPETCTSAKILITNTAGKAIQQLPLSVSGGHDNITIKAGLLQAGVYLYSLICDGKVVDTKRMVLTK